jgi:hypothetical protein
MIIFRHNIVAYLGCDYRRGMDWRMDLLTQLGIASKYSAIADLRPLKHY